MPAQRQEPHFDFRPEDYQPPPEAAAAAPARAKRGTKPARRALAAARAWRPSLVTIAIACGLAIGVASVAVTYAVISRPLPPSPVRGMPAGQEPVTAPAAEPTEPPPPPFLPPEATAPAEPPPPAPAAAQPQAVVAPPAVQPQAAAAPPAVATPQPERIAPAIRIAVPERAPDAHPRAVEAKDRTERRPRPEPQPKPVEQPDDAPYSHPPLDAADLPPPDRPITAPPPDQ